MGRAAQPLRQPHQDLPSHTAVIMQSSLIVLALLPLAVSAMFIRTFDRPDSPDLHVVPNGFGGNRLVAAYDSPDINTPDLGDNLLYTGGIGRAALVPSTVSYHQPLAT